MLKIFYTVIITSSLMGVNTPIWSAPSGQKLTIEELQQAIQVKKQAKIEALKKERERKAKRIQTSKIKCIGVKNNLPPEQTCFDFAINYEKEGQYDQAIKSYLKSIELNPKFTKAYNNLGLIYKKLKKFPLAIEYYQKVLSIDSHFFQAHNNLGALYSAQNKFTQAAKQYKKALSINPDYPQAYNNLGYVCSLQEDFTQAIVHFSQAIKLNPVYITAYYNLAYVYDELDKPIISREYRAIAKDLENQ